MCTFFVLYDPFWRLFIAAGRSVRTTTSINYAKHFTSEWSANNFRKHTGEPEAYRIIKIQHQ